MDTAIIILPALLRLLYGTGLRISEALSLKNKDINLDDNYLIVRDSKNGKERMIPISASLSEVFKEYVKYRNLMPLSILNEDRFLSLCQAVVVIEIMFVNGSEKYYGMLAYPEMIMGLVYMICGIPSACTRWL